MRRTGVLILLPFGADLTAAPTADRTARSQSRTFLQFAPERNAQVT